MITAIQRDRSHVSVLSKIGRLRKPAKFCKPIAQRALQFVISKRLKLAGRAHPGVSVPL
jgi:hypothetical protein